MCLVFTSPSEESKGRGKAIPVQVWTDPEACGRLRLPEFMTTGTLRW